MNSGRAQALAAELNGNVAGDWQHHAALGKVGSLKKERRSDMATRRETIEFLLGKLRQPKRFSARAMFGEYALYADGKVVALICDDLLYVKILPASQGLEPLCEKGEPYPGARPHYIVEEGQLSTLQTLPKILCAIAESLPEKRKRTARKRSLNQRR